MQRISIKFVVPKHCEGSDATTMTNCGFLLPIISDFYKTTARAGFLFSVTRSQPGGPSQVLARNFKDSAFSVLTYQSGKEYISVKRIKRQNKMRPTNNALNFLRETVSTTPEYIEAKKLLHEVYTTYYLSDHFAQTTDELKQAVAFQAVLFSDLLDDLFISSLQKTSKPCNS